MDKVPLGMFAVSRALQHRWSSVHRLLELAEKALAETVVSWKESGIPNPDEPNSGLSEDEGAAASAMNKSPGLKSLLHSPAGIEWLTDESGRVAAAQFVRKHKREPIQHPVDKSQIFDAYISYSRRDRKIVAELQRNLVKNGLAVFLDQDSINAGEVFQDTMEASLSTARSLIFMIGESTPASTFQRQEALAILDRQISEASETAPLIIPVVLPNADPQLMMSKFPELSRFMMIDLRGEPPPFVEATQDIVKALQPGTKKVYSKRK
jgi:hypothetical protein